jgi:Ran-binding protein 1
MMMQRVTQCVRLADANEFKKKFEDAQIINTGGTPPEGENEETNEEEEAEETAETEENAASEEKKEE